MRPTGLGALVYGIDPRFGAIDPAVPQSAGVTAVDDPHRAMKAADAIAVLTEWPEFGTLDWTAVAEQAPHAVVVDTRNVADADAARRAGLKYVANGRPGGN